MTVVLFASLVLSFGDFLRYLVNFSANKSSIVTQLTVWVSGIALVSLGAHAAVTAAIVLPGTGAPLGSLDAASIILVGMLASSLASVVVKVKQGVDNSDSAAVPPLIK